MDENLTPGDELSTLLRERDMHEQSIKAQKAEINRSLELVEISQKNIDKSRTLIADLDARILRAVQAQMGLI